MKLDFSAAEGERAKETLERIKETVPNDRETLFRAKVRWDGLSDVSGCVSFLDQREIDGHDLADDRSQVGTIGEAADGQISGGTRRRRFGDVRNRAPEGPQVADETR